MCFNKGVGPPPCHIDNFQAAVVQQCVTACQYTAAQRYIAVLTVLNIVQQCIIKYPHQGSACVEFIDKALAPDSPWKIAAESLTWGDVADDGVAGM